MNQVKASSKMLLVDQIISMSLWGKIFRAILAIPPPPAPPPPKKKVLPCDYGCMMWRSRKRFEWHYSHQDVNPSESVDDAMPVFEDIFDILRSAFMEG